MKSLLISILETICPNNVYLQGTLSEGDNPESFITFWTNYTEDGEHLDDEVVSIEWQFTVNYYSSDPSKVDSVPAQIRSALKSAGFIPQGKGNDLPSDRPSHTGWTMDFIIKEILN